MIIPILNYEITKAKRLCKIFDKVKDYDKISCNTNYIGLLGEMVLDRYLTKHNISHNWVQFIREGKGYNEPDFIMGHTTIDLKTTYSDSMWFQKPKHDIYIYANITEDNRFLIVKAWTTKELLEQSIINGQAKQVKRGNRIDYVIDTDISSVNNRTMLPIKWLVGISSTHSLNNGDTQ